MATQPATHPATQVEDGVGADARHGPDATETGTKTAETATETAAASAASRRARGAGVGLADAAIGADSDIADFFAELRRRAPIILAVIGDNIQELDIAAVARTLRLSNFWIIGTGMMAS